MEGRNTDDRLTGRWKTEAFSALDGSASTIPLSLGCITLVYSRMGPALLASAVFATMLCIAAIHLATAGSRRPILYSARFFEATALAAMLDRAIEHFPQWGLTDAPQVRVAILCAIVAGSGLWVGLLYAARAERFTRYIPVPVFAGFSNSIAVALLLSQAETLMHLFSSVQPPAQTLSVMLVALGAGVAVRRWRPRLPSAACALAVGLVVGGLLQLAGEPVETVGLSGWSFVPPILLADLKALGAPGVQHASLWGSLALDAAVLGTMIFINTSMTAQVMTHADERQSAGRKDKVIEVALMSASGIFGAVPLSGAMQSSVAASRTVPLTSFVLLTCSATTALVYLTGVLGWVPLAAVCGALLCEAWFMVDRRSVRLAWQWIRRQPMAHTAREDLALVAAVTVSAIIFNMTIAVLVGLMLGLALFAARNARKPIRNVWTGSQVRSNCARPRVDMQRLAVHAQAIRVFELEGDLFFGVADLLDRRLREGCEGVEAAVLDWSRVRHIDTSVAQSVAKFERHARLHGTAVIHAISTAQGSNAGAELQTHLASARVAPDMDRALELAENLILQQHADQVMSQQETVLIEATTLFHGMDDRERNLLEACMPQKLFSTGQALMQAGDPADELMLLLHGSASVEVHSPGRGNIRVAGVRRGATIGEIGFLDGAPRSASVIAQEDVMVAVLDRPRFDSLCESEPRLMQRLLANIALEVAARLRNTNHLAFTLQGKP